LQLDCCKPLFLVRPAGACSRTALLPFFHLNFPGAAIAIWLVRAISSSVIAFYNSCHAQCTYGCRTASAGEYHKARRPQQEAVKPGWATYLQPEMQESQ